jgi:hypothetical protein
VVSEDNYHIIPDAHLEAVMLKAIRIPGNQGTILCAGVSLYSVTAYFIANRQLKTLSPNGEAGRFVKAVRAVIRCVGEGKGASRTAKQHHQGHDFPHGGSLAAPEYVVTEDDISR